MSGAAPGLSRSSKRSIPRPSYLVLLLITVPLGGNDLLRSGKENRVAQRYRPSDPAIYFYLVEPLR